MFRRKILHNFSPATASDARIVSLGHLTRKLQSGDKFFTAQILRRTDGFEQQLRSAILNLSENCGFFDWHVLCVGWIEPKGKHSCVALQIW
jgi:hypothetical protein